MRCDAVFPSLTEPHDVSGKQIVRGVTTSGPAVLVALDSRRIGATRQDSDGVRGRRMDVAVEACPTSAEVLPQLVAAPAPFQLVASAPMLRRLLAVSASFALAACAAAATHSA